MTLRLPRLCSRLLSIAIALLLSGVVFIPSAFASHYYLDDIEFVSPQVIQELKALGMKDTEDLLNKVRTPAGRKDLAQATTLNAEQVMEIAHTCEFLQIEGVGPKASRLLRASGIKSVRVLAKAQAKPLLQRIIEVNAEQAITGINPDLAVVEDWIQKATRVSLLLE